MPNTNRPRSRSRRTVGLVAGVVTTAFLLVASAGLPVYVFPRVDSPGESDVILVLGPPTQNRVRLAQQLAAEGYARQLLVSVPSRGPQSAKQLEVCNDDTLPYEVSCFTPHPFTTQGEAQALRRLADEDQVQSALVITMTPHVSRARVILERCFDGELRMLSDNATIPLITWAYQYVYQSAGFLKVATRSGC